MKLRSRDFDRECEFPSNGSKEFYKTKRIYLFIYLFIYQF